MAVAYTTIATDGPSSRGPDTFLHSQHDQLSTAISRR